MQLDHPALAPQMHVLPADFDSTKPVTVEGCQSVDIRSLASALPNNSYKHGQRAAARAQLDILAERQHRMCRFTCVSVPVIDVYHFFGNQIYYCKLS